MLHRLALLVLVPLAVACPRSQVDTPPGVLVRVGYVAVDPRAGSPVLVLEDEHHGRTLPIWIGFSEAQSIATEMEHRKLPRPNTHDLAKRVLDRLQGRVEHVVVTELREGTYYATLVVLADGQRVEIDARPSDAIALALRFEAPVYVHESLFRAIDSIPEAGESERRAGLPVAPPTGIGRESATRPS